VADVVAGPGLPSRFALWLGLRWRILRNSLRNKSPRLDLIGLIFSGFFSLLFVIGVTLAFFFVTRYLFEKHLEPLFGLVFLALLVCGSPSYFYLRIRAAISLSDAASVS